ncbi:conserved hypothetical protein [Ruegeria lacuscaerulensis ITI-1157]|nr:conserved hypothetical protein [Ruegeria lacuscaerulensis ITI-1157]SHI91210.1 hypothetical protein SAMN05444404_0982 [Ruegeria lacuscaerulensis ITI-1157]
MARPKVRNLPDLTHLAQPGQHIQVRVTPKAARDRIQADESSVHIAVTAPAEGGKANLAVARILAKAMGIAPSALILKQGQTARNKLFVYEP